MPLDARDHQQVKATTKERRNTGAKRARSSRPDRFHTVQLVPVTLPSGEETLLAFTLADADRPYILHHRDGQWACSCFNARYSVKRTCAHQEAANAERTA